MTKPLVVSQSKLIPAGAEELFAMLPVLPLEKVYRRWHGPFPPIRQVIHHDGEWRQTGQKRTMVLKGGSAVAEVSHIDPPHLFTYRLTEMKGLLAGMDHVEGRVTFDPGDAAGTQVTWQWTIYPRSSLTALALPIVGRSWPGWALKALEEMANRAAS